MIPFSRKRKLAFSTRLQGRRRAALHLESLEDRTVPTFLAPTDLTVGEGPQGVAVADFTGDGALDLVATNGFPSEMGVVLLKGNGDGTFQEPVGLAKGRHGPVVTADFNGDALPDLAFTNITLSGGVSVLLNNSDGTFQSAGDLAGGGSLAAADLNGDTIIDLVSNTRVHLGNGDGTFRFGSQIEGTGLHIAMADFNGDSHIDLMTPFSDAGILILYLGNGNGTFQSPPLGYDIVTGGQDALATGDFNGDGIADVAVTGVSRVTVLLGEGHGPGHSFVFPRRTFPVDASTTSLGAADLNGDGALDFVAGGSVLLGNGDGTFRTAQEYFVGDLIRDVAFGDFNADGALDFVTANGGGATLNVRLNNGDGTFQRAPRYGRPTTSYWSIATADINDDGLLDLATTAGILLGNGDGSFQEPIPFSVPGFPQALAILNGGDRLAVGSGARVHILEHVGGGSFQMAASYTLTTAPRDGLMRVAVGDLNNDSIDDLVTTGIRGVDVFLGSSDGTFQRTASPRTDAYASSVTIADLNGDGSPDLAIGTGEFAAAGTHRVIVILGNGDGTFQPGVEYDVGINPNAVVAADFDNDGAMDLAALDQWGGRLYVLRGRGDGTFEVGAPIRITGGTSAYDLILGDFNGDGIPDLAAIGDNGVGVLLGRGDGTFGPLRHYGATGIPLSLTAGDFNDDGFLDLAVAGEHGGIAILLGAPD